MAYTLHEALRQIDPYVRLFDGQNVTTVERRLKGIDPKDHTEFVISVDSQHRLMLLQLNLRGCPIYPPVLIEQKSHDPIVELRNPPLVKSDFGFSNLGYA